MIIRMLAGGQNAVLMLARRPVELAGGAELPSHDMQEEPLHNSDRLHGVRALLGLAWRFGRLGSLLLLGGRRRVNRESDWDLQALVRKQRREVVRVGGNDGALEDVPRGVKLLEGEHGKEMTRERDQRQARCWDERCRDVQYKGGKGKEKKAGSGE